MNDQAPQRDPRARQIYGLVPSVVTFALVLVFVVLLFEYTNIFTEWLAWVVVPTVIALVGYDAWLRGKGRIED